MLFVNRPMGLSLREVIDWTDPGDETQRNFRYQHAYGVILLIAAACGKKPYVALWCEHHEDFVAECQDGRYDAYQVKTQKPELGAWQLNDDALRGSIKRFVELETKSPEQVSSFTFVSNTSCLDSTHARFKGRSPIQFVLFLERIQRVTDFIEPYKFAFDELRDHCDCDAETLFMVLKKVRIVKGPDRDGFNDALAHTHLPQLSPCETYAPKQLDDLRDELIDKVHRASALVISDPSRHWCCVRQEDHLNPRLAAKKVAVNEVLLTIAERNPARFKYLHLAKQMSIGTTSLTTPVLEKKMINNHLVNHVDFIRHRALSAERSLLTFSYKRPVGFEVVLDQLVGVVQGECNEAELAATLSGGDIGPAMLLDVTKRLRAVAKEEATKVEHFPYETLIGVAGLLTEECSVWWGPRFDIEVAV